LISIKDTNGEEEEQEERWIIPAVRAGRTSGRTKRREETISITERRRRPKRRETRGEEEEEEHEAKAGESGLLSMNEWIRSSAFRELNAIHMTRRYIVIEEGMRERQERSGSFDG
jgi:hypothetical protein